MAALIAASGLISSSSRAMDHSAAANAHHQVEEAWIQGFIERGGEKLLAAMESDDPNALEEYLKSIDAQKAIIETDEIVIGCIDERCCCKGLRGSAGSYALNADSNGKPHVLTPYQCAERILKTPDVMESTGDIVYTIHGKGGACGARKIARTLLHESTEPADLEKYDAEQGQAVVDALNDKLSLIPGNKRKATLRVIETSCPAGHPGQVIYATALGPNLAFDREYKELPQGMELDRGLCMTYEDFALQLKTGISILAGEHGSGKDPIMIVVLAANEQQKAKVQQEVDKIVKSLTTAETFGKRVIARAAVVAA
jgi:hypothetical protein